MKLVVAASRAPAVDAELSIGLVRGFAFERFDDHLPALGKIGRLAELYEQLLQDAVVVGDVARWLPSQLLTRVALEHQSNSAELVYLVELRRHFLLHCVPVRAELIDDGIHHHTVLFTAESGTLFVDGVFGENVEPAALEFLSKGVQGGIEVAGTRRIRDALEVGLFEYAGNPCGAHAQRLVRQAREGRAQLAPVVP